MRAALATALGLTIFLVWAGIGSDEAPAPVLGPARSGSSLDRSASRGGWRLATADRLEYSIDLASELEVVRDFLARGSSGAEGLGERFATSIAGRMTLTVLAATPAEFVVLAQIEGAATLEMEGSRFDAEPGSPFALALAEGMELELSPDGAIRRARTELPRSSPVYGVFAHALATAQFAVPRGAGDSWSVVEESPGGRYDARYEAEKGGSGETLRIRKARAWTDLGSAGVAGDAEGGFVGTFDEKAGCLVALEGREALLARRDRAVLYKSRTEIRLALVARTRAADSVLENLPELPPADPLFVPLANDPLDADRELVAGESIDLILAQLAHALDTGADPMSVLPRMAAAIRLDPISAGRVVSQVLALSPGDQVEMYLFAALSAAGTPEAERALLDLGAARRSESASLSALVAAFQNLESPSRSVEEFLRGVYSDPGIDRELAGAALLAQGTVAFRTRAGDEERSLAIVREIEILLESGAADPCAALHALGNAGRAESLDSIELWLAPTEPPQLRSAAAYALRHMPGEAAERLLALALEDETADVRLGAATAFSERTLGPVATASLARALESDPDPKVRIAALRAFGAGRLADPARLAIERASRADPEEDVRLLAAEALVEASRGR